MKWCRDGASRDVFLIGGLAFKLPKLFHGWKLFLCGLLANMQEASFSRTNWPQLCPVWFRIPGGFLIVMPRCEPLTDEEWEAFDALGFLDQPDYIVPAEEKRSSFGKRGGCIYAVDYGN